MRRIIAIAVIALMALSVVSVAAGSPHEVGQTSVTVSGNTITVSGKIAGLGNETQVHVELTADAECVNRGGHNPSAANKTSVSAAGDFPVQNGKALFTLTATASFQPDCSPPMSVTFSNVSVVDTTHNLVLVP